MKGPKLTGLKPSEGKPVIDTDSDRFLPSGRYRLEQVLTGHIGVVSLAGVQYGAQNEYEIRHVYDAGSVETILQREGDC